MSFAYCNSRALACADTTFVALEAATMWPIARACDADRITDLAILLSPARLAVVRCAARARAEDHAALATMLAEGDFVWAGLVCGEREGAERLGLVECFHVDELDRLVARLSELREAFGAAG